MTVYNGRNPHLHCRDLIINLDNSQNPEALRDLRVYILIKVWKLYTCVPLFFVVFSKSEPCGKPEDIPHSKVVDSSFNFNDQLRYRCVEGYTLTGPRLRTCGEDGEWSEAPTCEGK